MVQTRTLIAAGAVGAGLLVARNLGGSREGEIVTCDYQGEVEQLDGRAAQHVHDAQAVCGGGGGVDGGVEMYLRERTGVTYRYCVTSQCERDRLEKLGWQPNRYVGSDGQTEAGQESGEATRKRVYR